MIDTKIKDKLKAMRKETKMSQRNFASHFNIPTRTLQKWEGEQSSPPKYIPMMMEKILTYEGLIGSQTNTDNNEKKGD